LANILEENSSVVFDSGLKTASFVEQAPGSLKFSHLLGANVLSRDRSELVGWKLPSMSWHQARVISA